MKTAKNVFNEGMILDFNPVNSSNGAYTSALNATLTTSNGNEYALQNDMGNGRVETAYLPEGYVPVGTCEYGGIIYIVSYNPLINKSQIGCFPSPERNIESEETGEPNVSLRWQDFQGSINGEPNGKLNTTSVKKILISKSMNAGDKYAICADDLDETRLSDYGGSNPFPKLVKVHVVSIEDSGKITYLDSSVKWYDKYYIQETKNLTKGTDLDQYRTIVNSAYSVFASKVSGQLGVLVELEKITGFSCTWSVYNVDTVNKNYPIYWNINWTTDDNNINPSGIILTKSECSAGAFSIPTAYNYNNPKAACNMQGFSRSYKPEEFKGDYDSFLQENYDTAADAVSASKITIDLQKGIPNVGKYYLDATKITASNGTTTYYGTDGKALKSVLINDDVVNNKYSYPVIKEFNTFKNIPKGSIYSYSVAPIMPYGVLEEFVQNGQIDFDKIGTKSIEINKWKYYVQDETVALNWGLQAYTEPNKAIEKVIILFYDDQGIAAAYHCTGKISYNGSFTEYLALDSHNYKFANLTADDTDFYHKGIAIKKEDMDKEIIYVTEDGNPVIKEKTEGADFDIAKDGVTYYTNDAGILYSNSLYYVKIIVKYSTISALNTYIDPEYYEVGHRWLWTNTIFNEYYSNKEDFNGLKPELTLDCNVSYKLNDNWKSAQYNAPYKNSAVTDAYSTLSATVQYINQAGNKNIEVNIEKGLVNDYSTFNINADAESAILTQMYLGKEIIQNYPEQPEVIQTQEYADIFKGLYPTSALKGLVDTSVSNAITSMVGSSITGTGEELWASDLAYTNYANNLHLYGDTSSKETLNYINYTGESGEYECEKLDDITKLSFSGIHFSKYYYFNKYDTTQALVLKAFVSTEEDLKNYNISIYSYNNNSVKTYIPYFNKVLFIGMNGANTPTFNSTVATLTMNGQGTATYSTDFTTRTITYKKYNYSDLIITNSDDLLNSDKDISITEALNYVQGIIKDEFNFLFPLCIGSNKAKGSPAVRNGTTNYISNNTLISEDSDNELYSADNLHNSFGGLEHAFATTSDINQDTKYFTLGGTLCGLTSTGKSIAGYHFSANAATTQFMPYVLGYLTQLYYLSDDKDPINQWIPYNYVYLKDNYTLYTRDVIVKMQEDSNSNLLSDLILFKQWKPYNTYLNDMSKHGVDSSHIKEMELTIKESIKNYPIQIKIPYVTPTTIESSSKIIVQNAIGDLPGTTEQNISNNRVYYYNYNEGKFEIASRCTMLHKIESVELTSTDGTTQELKVIPSDKYFGVGSISSRLAYNNGILTLDSVPAATSSTASYAIKVINSSSGNGSRKFVGFKEGVIYYNVNSYDYIYTK